MTNCDCSRHSNHFYSHSNHIYWQCIDEKLSIQWHQCMVLSPHIHRTSCETFIRFILLNTQHESSETQYCSDVTICHWCYRYLVLMQCTVRLNETVCKSSVWCMTTNWKDVHFALGPSIQSYLFWRIYHIIHILLTDFEPSRRWSTKFVVIFSLARC